MAVKKLRAVRVVGDWDGVFKVGDIVETDGMPMMESVESPGGFSYFITKDLIVDAGDGEIVEFEKLGDA